jgi:uncharacterized repeat protein (TIGR01451 family)
VTEQKRGTHITTSARAGRIVLSTVVGLLLTLGIVMAQSLEFSTMIGPQYARPNDVITYTIIALNTTGVWVPDVVLSDVLPSKTTFITNSCSYDYGYGAQPLPCGPLNKMWEIDFFPDTRITTTLAATVTAVTSGTSHVSLVNRAYINWGDDQQELSFTTTVLAAIPEFALFYEPKPPNADTDGAITYTIVARNTGDSVCDVVLSDTLPSGVAFVPDSCVYYVTPPGSMSLRFPCNDLLPGQKRLVWREDMPHGTRITTTFLVTVTVPEGSARWPLPNCAYLGWSVIREEICATSLANPTVYAYLPRTMRNYRHDLYEPNDTPDQAYGPLVSGQVYPAYIWDTTDQDDYYHITPLTSTTDVYIQLTDIPTNRNYDLYVYYYDPVSCAAYNGYCQVAMSAQLDNTDESVTFAPVAERQYFIRVYSDIAQGGGYSDKQPYSLMATYE